MEGHMPGPHIREALDRVARAIAAEPGKASTKGVPATARLVAGLQCEVTGPNGEAIVTDMPAAMGGGGAGPNPGWLFRASLASCTSTAIAMRAAMLGLHLSTLEVTVESTADLRGNLGLDDRVSAALSSLSTRVRIGAEDATEEELRQLVDWGQGHSPMTCTVRDAPRMSLSVELA
jgi:uncharacterized OsmC-like protein